MEYQSLIDNLTPDIVARLRQAIETGRWPDGRQVTPEQREHSLQAVIAWEQKHVPETERVGYIPKGKKAELAAKARPDDPQAMRWVADSANDGDDTV